MSSTRHVNELAVALLRGINVGGKNLLPMKALAEMFAAAGCSEIKTYIQSGNVIFRSSQGSKVPDAVRGAIEKDYGLKVPVIVRSAREMMKTLSDNPFLGCDAEESLLHVLFLEDSPSKNLVAGLDLARGASTTTSPDEFAVKGRDIYLLLPHGAARTKLTNAYFDSKLKTVSTQRNWRTVKTLTEMMAD